MMMIMFLGFFVFCFVVCGVVFVLFWFFFPLCRVRTKKLLWTPLRFFLHTLPVRQEICHGFGL